LLAIGCGGSEDEKETSYIESKPSFFELKRGDVTKNSWIKRPQNLQMIHETFKKFGYKNLLTKETLSAKPFLFEGIYINKTGYNLLDSLQLTYTQPYIKEKYYREFWSRRRSEKNDKIVFEIIKEINFAVKNNANSEIIAKKSNPQLVNDTLINLLRIGYSNQKITKHIAIQNFETLKRFGFHQSAFNLLDGVSYYSLNRDSLVKTLKASDTKQNFVPWIERSSP
jgi:hypothetical protein